MTVLSPGQTTYSVLLVNNGEIVESSLAQFNHTQEWVQKAIKRNGFRSPSELFCMEWTPRKGFYFVTFEGNVKRGKEEFDSEDIDPDNAQV